MDDTTLQSLEAAYALTPQNHALLAVLTHEARHRRTAMRMATVNQNGAGIDSNGLADPSAYFVYPRILDEDQIAAHDGDLGLVRTEYQSSRRKWPFHAD